MAERKDKTDDQQAQPSAPAEQPKKQQPSLGRAVHYVQGGIHHAALIIDAAAISLPRINDDGSERAPVQTLVVFLASGGTVTASAVEGDPSEEGSWHWPEYVPAK